MKKTLVSAAFVAVSGIYVAGANHLFTPPEVAGTAMADATAVPAEPAAVAVSAAPVPAVLSSVTPPPVAPLPPSSPSPSLPSQKPSSALLGIVIAEQDDDDDEARVAVPLPRARPSPPVSAMRTAAASDVAATTTSGYRDGTYTGTDENAYYGRVRVQVTVSNHQIARVKVLNYPSDRRTSRYINSIALPRLEQEVISANSASVDTISGATLTSQAYIRSLGNALGQAGGANA